MKPLFSFLTILGWAGLTFTASAAQPLRALIVAGGCCHDYATQKDLLKEGLEKRIHVQIDVAYTADRSTQARFAAYEKPDWAKNYDVIIHDECSADVKDMPYVENILNAHKAGVAAINLHCAMHSYRTGTEDWFSFVGIQSSRHGPQKPIEITFTDAEHPITKGLDGWTTGNEELYNNLKVFDSAHPLASGKQDTGRQVDEFVVAWVNDFHGTRVFSTTLGHNNNLVEDDRYLNLLARGLLWSCHKLDDSGNPLPGYGAQK